MCALVDERELLSSCRRSSSKLTRSSFVFALVPTVDRCPLIARSPAIARLWSSGHVCPVTYNDVHVLVSGVPVFGCRPGRVDCRLTPLPICLLPVRLETGLSRSRRSLTPHSLSPSEEEVSCQYDDRSRAQLSDPAWSGPGLKARAHLAPRPLPAPRPAPPECSERSSSLPPARQTSPSVRPIHERACLVHGRAPS